MTEPRNVIRQRRLALGLTQEEAGQRIGMDRSQFNQTERGKRAVGLGVALRLVRLLGGEATDYITRPPSSAIEIAEQLVRRLDEGENVDSEALTRVAAQLDETAALSSALATRLRGGAEAARSAS